MSSILIHPAPAFTARLLPPHHDSIAAAGHATLLPLICHWVTALMLRHDALDQLTSPDGKLRALLEIGNPLYWSRHGRTYPIEYADDQEAGAKGECRREARRIAELLADAQAKIEGNTVDFSHPLFTNLAMLGDLLGLSDTELSVLCIVTLLTNDRGFCSNVAAFDIKVETEAEGSALLADLLCSPASDLRLALRADGALRSLGLLQLATERCDLEAYFSLADGLPALLMTTHASPAPLVRHFFSPGAGGTLEVTHFPHLAGEIHIIADILRQAMQQSIRGTNVLLYGPPGVGKTELASAVARQLGAALYEVSCADKDGDPIRGARRLQSYNLCQRMLSRRNDALVLFDEVEDMLEQGETPGKAWVNRALEENPVPAIWITNRMEAMDPAYRRRFDYSLRMDTPPRTVRRQIALHHLRDIAGDDAEHGWLADLAECAEITPGQMGRAGKVARLVEAASLASGDTLPARQCVLQVLERSASLLQQARPRPGRAMATAYDTAYLHTDTPVGDIVASLRQSPGGSFCLYGQSGTGKTALARHIAHALELPLVMRRASDLLSMYVGGTEKGIAEMFQAARAEPCVLLLDEADSFLQSRAAARHSWEITQVNELLTQMEEYDGLFICTTNLVERLDPASLRRFDWKIAFQPMNAAQRWAFFLQELHLLGGEIEAARPLQAQVCQQLNGITPGDFAPVTRQFRLLRRVPGAPELLQRLRGEIQARQGGAGQAQAWRQALPASSNKSIPVAV